MLYYKLKSLKYNKPSNNNKSINIKRELFTIARIINQLKIIIKVEDNKEDITRLV